MAADDQRSSLKVDFSDGKIPTGGHFASLIDAFALQTQITDDIVPAIEELKQPKDGVFSESVSIGPEKQAWHLSRLDNGTLQFQADANTKAAWLQMPARLGSMPTDPKLQADLPTVAALESEVHTLNERDMVLVKPGPRAFAVELMAHVAPVHPQHLGKLEKIWRAVVSPPPRDAIVHAVALAAGGDGSCTVNQSVTPRTSWAKAAMRTGMELLLVALLVIGAAYFFKSNETDRIADTKILKTTSNKRLNAVLTDLFCLPTTVVKHIFSSSSAGCQFNRDGGPVQLAAIGDGRLLVSQYVIVAGSVFFLAFIGFRSLRLWRGMRRSIVLEWVPDGSPKVPQLMLRRRGLLGTQSVHVRYHMTQLWG